MIDSSLETQNNIIEDEDFASVSQYFNNLGKSDSDKTLKTHCLAYLICKYSSNTKAKDYFIENGADLKAAKKLLQSLKAEEDLNLYLNHAFTWDSLFLLKTILLLGADFGKALLREAEAGHTERVELLLEADKQTEAVNAKDYYGWTALMLAAREGHTDIVKVILAHKDIDVNAKNKYDETALMWAANKGHTDTVKALLAHKDIIVNDKSNDGKTALMWAAIKGHTDTVKALLARKYILVNATNNYNWTALMYAAREGHTAVVQALLKHEDIKVNDKNANSLTALMIAAARGHTAVVQALLKQEDIKVNAKDNICWTALMWAAVRGHTDTVKELIAHKDIEVNTKDEDGWTALMWAADKGHTEIENLLKTHIENKDKKLQRKTQNTDTANEPQEPPRKKQNTKSSTTKKSLFSGAFTASLFAAIAATISFGLKLPVFTILGGPLVFIALAAVAGFIAGAGLAVAITAYSNRNAVIENTINGTHRESKPMVGFNNANNVVNAYAAVKNVGTDVANGQRHNTKQRSFLGCNIV